MPGYLFEVVSSRLSFIIFSFLVGDRNLLAICLRAENDLTLVWGVKKRTVHCYPTHCSKDARGDETRNTSSI